MTDTETMRAPPMSLPPEKMSDRELLLAIYTRQGTLEREVSQLGIRIGEHDALLRSVESNTSMVGVEVQRHGIHLAEIAGNCARNHPVPPKLSVPPTEDSSPNSEAQEA